MNFQDLILRLQSYWGQQGCALLQPYDMEVGAGTFHTATFLRALGPEPWRAAYVQPSRRPKDGRYGENPNRLQHYYQFQVILKPSPSNSQELYLGSLEALGIDPVSTELTYGLERLAMYVQGVENVFDLDWNGRPGDHGGMTYGDVYLQSEREFSAFNFEQATTDKL